MLPKRLFVALDLPNSAAGELEKLTTPLPGVRWEPRDKLHLTLVFLGDGVPANVVVRLHETLSAVRVPAFFLPLVGVGSFGGSSPRTLWIGTGCGHPHLFALHKAVSDAVLAAGWRPDLKSFVPHVTLARCGRDANLGPVRRFRREHEDFDAGLIKVESFALYSSFRGLYSEELRVSLPT